MPQFLQLFASSIGFVGMVTGECDFCVGEFFLSLSCCSIVIKEVWYIQWPNI